MKIRHRHRYQRLILMILIMLACIGIAELLARSWMVTQKQQVMLAEQLAYQGLDYFNDPAFIAERRQATNNIRPASDWSGWINEDLHGKYFNVTNGIRHVVGQPENYTNTVYLFGSSTIFDVMLPDKDTIASQLQAHLSPYSLRVVNLGVSSATSEMQLAYLQTIHLVSGDVVIFYDGVMEAEVIYLDQDKKKLSTVPICNTIWHSPIMIAQLACNLYFHHVDLNSLEQPLERVASDYETTLEQAKAFTIAHNATFYHFLQPHVFTRPLSQYEMALANDPTLSKVGVEPIYRVLYPKLQSVTRKLGGTDLTAILDEPRGAGMMLYTDNMHLTKQGNTMIADTIFEVIAPNLKVDNQSSVPVH